MTMRVTGLISGMDTESMITELTKANSQKVEKYKGDQKKLEWTKDAWKDLNKEIVTFYKGALSDMRFDSAFNKKTTNVSDSSAASVITSDNAMLATLKGSSSRNERVCDLRRDRRVKGHREQRQGRDHT